MVKRLSLLLLFLVFSFSITGVYAVWTFSEGAMTSNNESMNMNISVFEYKPEEILPGGDSEKPEIGQNHLILIDLVLNEDSKGYGLNINDNVLIHQYLKRESVIYCNQKVSGGNLKFILDAKTNTHKMYYCVEKVSDVIYYAYTFSTDEMQAAIGLDKEITVYRTTLEKKDEWVGTVSYYGYAKVKSLDDLGQSASSNTIPYSIDVSTWHM